MTNKENISDLLIQLSERHQTDVLLKTNINRDILLLSYPKNEQANNAQYEIGSATKMFTALSILFLAEQEKLDLQDSIGKYLPEPVCHSLFINEIDYSKVTIKSILNHTSGLGEHLNSGDDEAILEVLKDRSDDISLFEIIEMCKNNSVQPFYAPNSQFQYSNLGYILLGKIIEYITNADYKFFIKSDILKPLKMDNTTFLSEINQNGPAGQFRQQSIKMPSSIALSAGEMVSTLNDMSTFLNAIFSDFTGDKIQSLIINSVENSINKEMHYGLGFYKENNLIGHSGGTFGFSTKAFINTETLEYFIVSIAEGEMKGGLTPLFEKALVRN